MAKRGSNQNSELRRTRILQLLHDRGECSVEDLAAQFSVSAMTIRRDLQDLADEGRVTRTHGGATATSRVTFEFSYLERMQVQHAAKAAIATKAVELVAEGESVFIGSGTTTLAIAERIRTRQNLTVVTSSLPVASILYGCKDINLLLVGGYLRHDEPDLGGAITESNLDMIKPDVAFLGTDGVDEQGNTYSTRASFPIILGHLGKPARRVFIVADHTKMGKTCLVRLLNLRDRAGLITDQGLDQAFARKITSAGVNLIVA